MYTAWPHTHLLSFSASLILIEKFIPFCHLYFSFFSRPIRIYSVTLSFFYKLFFFFVRFLCQPFCSFCSYVSIFLLSFTLSINTMPIANFNFRTFKRKRKCDRKSVCFLIFSTSEAWLLCIVSYNLVSCISFQVFGGFPPVFFRGFRQFSIFANVPKVHNTFFGYTDIPNVGWTVRHSVFFVFKGTVAWYLN